MLLSWSELHSDLPAALFVEETLEASLSRLASAAAAGYRIDSATDLGRVYSVECRAKLVPYDADDIVSQDRVVAMQLRLEKVLQLCSQGKLPWLQKQDKTHRVAVVEWPAARSHLRAPTSRRSCRAGPIGAGTPRPLRRCGGRW